MERYKDAIYASYITFHNSDLYGKIDLEKFEKHFPINDHYLGAFLPQHKEAYLLDIGCGDGNLVYWMQKKGYKNVFGVDVSKEQIQAGQALGIPNLVCQDLAEFLNSNQQKFDLIIARDVLEHFDRQMVFDILSLVNQSLNKDGQFLIQVPNGEGLHSRAILYGDITHEWAYTHSALSQLGKAIGFSAIQTYPLRPYSKGVKGAIRSILWTLKELELGFWKWIETGKTSGIYTSNLIARFSK